MPDATAEFPVFERLANHAPPVALLVQGACPHHRLNDFAEGTDIPPELRAIAAKHGYECTDHEGRGLLLVGNAGVTTHTDEEPSIVWMLTSRAEKNELIIEGEPHHLRVGDVIVFDATKRHAFFTDMAGEWSLFSTYVRKISHKAEAR